MPPTCRLCSPPAWKAGEVVVVAQLDPALVELLGRVLAADADDPFVVEPDEVRVERRLVPRVGLPAQRGLVQRLVAVPGVAQRRAVDPVLEVGGRLERRHAAEVARLVLAAVVAADVDDLVLRRLPAQLAERQVRLERAGEGAGVLAELTGEGRVDADRRRGLLVVAFIGKEEVELVLDDRPADREAGLVALVALVGGERRVLEALRQLRHPPLRAGRNRRAGRAGRCRPTW